MFTPGECILRPEAAIVVYPLEEPLLRGEYFDRGGLHNYIGYNVKIGLKCALLSFSYAVRFGNRATRLPDSHHKTLQEVLLKLFFR